MNELAELKKRVLDLSAKVDVLNDTLGFIKDIPLTSLAKNLSISRQTLKYHIENNYLQDRDFYKQNDKIYISVGILQNIKAHYGK
jgi:DNA-binding XRE family transcriptional regulator